MPEAVELQLTVPAELGPEPDVLEELRQRVAAAMAGGCDGDVSDGHVLVAAVCERADRGDVTLRAGWASSISTIGKQHAQRAAAGETVRAEPFDTIDWRVGVLFGEEDDD
jgi:hypothetical protein